MGIQYIAGTTLDNILITKVKFARWFSTLIANDRFRMATIHKAIMLSRKSKQTALPIFWITFVPFLQLNKTSFQFFNIHFKFTEQCVLRKYICTIHNQMYETRVENCDQYFCYHRGISKNDLCTNRSAHKILDRSGSHSHLPHQYS